MNKIIQTISESIDDRRITKLEKEYKINLPVEYKEFLIQFNGGVPEKTVFNYGEGLYADSMVFYFFSLDSQHDAQDIEWNYQNYTQSQRIQSSMFPIGCDPGGNIICISLANDNYGEVYFLDHDEDRENYHLVGKSFNSFLNSLAVES